jgi:hypothetical protein
MSLSTIGKAFSGSNADLRLWAFTGGVPDEANQPFFSGGGGVCPSVLIAGSAEAELWTAVMG